MANRLRSALLMLMLWAPAVGASSILAGCRSTAPEIHKPEPVEQRAGERDEPRRERRAPRLARKEYDG
jgi:hypothetical protein